MTLRDLFDSVQAQPFWAVVLFLMIPLTAFLLAWSANDKGGSSPWKYIFAFLIYLTSIPGILSLAFNLYLFLFERKSIFDANLVLQVLPILSMVFTLQVIKYYVPLNLIPGFKKLSGLFMVIFITICIMWFADRTHIYAIAFLGFGQVLLIFLILLAGVYYGWTLMTKSSKTSITE